MCGALHHEKKIAHLILRMAVFLLVLSSMVSLMTSFFGFPVYPPYVPLIFLIFVVLSDVLIQLRISKFDGTGVAVFLIAFIPISLSTLAKEPSSAMQSSGVYLYFYFAFVVFRSLLRIGVLSIDTFAKYFSNCFYIISAIGFIQMVTGTPFGMVARYLGSGSNEGAMFNGTFRVSSMMTSPNVFALTMCFLLPLVVWYQSNSIARNKQLLTVTGIVLLGGTLVVASGSRAGVLFLFASLVSSYVFRLRKKMGRVKVDWVRALFILFVLFSVIPMAQLCIPPDNVITGRLLLNTDSGRVAMNMAALNLLEDPSVLIIGVGSNQFFNELYYRGITIAYKPWADYSQLNSTVHNWVLQILTENGLLTFTAWVYLVGKTFRRSLWLLKAGDNKAYFILGQSLLITFLIPLQFDTSISNPTVLTLIAASTAIVNERVCQIKRHEKCLCQKTVSS